MPDIGEIRKAKDLGRQGWNKFIWQACDICSKERWVQLSKGEPLMRHCKACGHIGNLNGRWKGGLIERTCLQCGKSFYVKPNKLRHERGKFCSKICGIKYNLRIGDKHPRWKEPINRTCEECGKEFYVKPHVVKDGNGRFCSRSCHMIFHRKLGVFRQRPNNPEMVLIKVMAENNLPFKYVGNGEIWFGNRNPDFINSNGKKQVIELLGTYWHPLFDGASRREHYKQYGFDCLALWEDELGDIEAIAKKVKTFTRQKHAIK